MPGLENTRAGIALVIGVGEYERAERVETLRFATRDAVALADVLADPSLCAFPREQVVLLTNGDARRDELVQRLSRWLPERARGTELVVIYFAGHGMVQTVGRREEGFLLPYDADPDDVVTRGIAMSDIARWIDGLDTQAVVVCLDCCHAGKVLGQRDGGTAREARNMELRPAVLQAMSGKGRYLIASCDEGQKSYECADLGHGLFTFHLLRGIAGEADRDGDGRVGLAELFNYVATAVSRDARERFGREQKPWTSATWAEETYISTLNRTIVVDADPFEGIWRKEGAAAAVHKIDQTMRQADEAWLGRALRFLGRVKEPDGITSIFRCLSHASETVRNEARAALHCFSWETVVSTLEGVARSGAPDTAAAVLDGLNAFEAHPRVVALLDRLVVLLKGELRNRTILLQERKRLGLELESVAALFREIHSPYQIQKVLGQGLFTNTYLACDEGTGLEVVVRVLRPEFANQPDVRAAFLDLSNRSVHLVHEKLALTREARAFPDRNIYFAVRDHVPGVTLQRVLEMQKSFEPIQVVRLLREVAEALTPLHRKAMCHGGIKPSNIFLCEGNRVVLGDTCLPTKGIGVALDRLSYDYRYAAPEMFLGSGVVSPQSDFYALGCVAYELLCGAPPFVSDNFHELAARHIRDPIMPPTQRGSPLGALGDAIILKLLARSPGERFATLNEVLQGLASLDRALEEHSPLYKGTVSPRPLVGDESIMNYQGGQSVLNLEQTGGTVTLDLGTGPSIEAANEKSELQIPDYEILEGLGKGGMGTVYKAIDRLGQPLALKLTRTEMRPLPEIPDYEILEVLGEGGMGTVYKAIDARLKRTVALKVLRAGLGHSPEQQARFLAEARAVAGLQHPNIVAIYAMIEHQRFMCLVLEYVDGGDLARKMRGDGEVAGPMPIREAAAVMATLAQAVDYAHRQGVLHRDLKPSNILLSRDGQPKISDFGLAKQLGDAVELTHSGQIIGTPAYMAPEQADISRGIVGPAADVYALGTIFYEMLSGRRPFTGAGAQELLLRIQSEKPTPPSHLRSEIPPELDSICLKCMEKDPTQRYASAAALAEDLERWSRGEPITAKPPGFWKRLVRFLPFRKTRTGPHANQAPGA
jgi:serine/threonine protein kinase